MRQGAGFVSENAGIDALCQPICDDFCQQLRCGVRSRKRRLVIEVAIVQLSKHGMNDLAGSRDVDDNVARIKIVAAKSDVDNVGRAVQPLRWAELFATEAVRDHDVVAHSHAEHADSISSYVMT